MKKFFYGNTFKILIACLFISTGICIFHFVPGANFIPSVINSITVPMQNLSNDAINAALEVLPHAEKTSEEYENEIKNLKEEVKRLRAVVVDYYEVKKENTQYLKFYNFKKQNNSLNFSPASVIAKDPNDLFYGFILNRGSSDGISVNDPVITENALIGRVIEVKNHSCRVKTILSPEDKIGVIDKATGDSGVIIGRKSLADQNETAMMYVSAQNKMQLDDIVVTTGLGGICPKDLPVGKIKEIKNDGYDSSFFAVIEPFDNVKNIIDVFVITDFSGKGNIISEVLTTNK